MFFRGHTLVVSFWGISEVFLEILNWHWQIVSDISLFLGKTVALKLSFLQLFKAFF